MAINADLVGILSSIIISILSAGVIYGVMRTKIERLELDIAKMENDFVAIEVFKTHVSKIEQDLTELKKDVRLLLLHFIARKPDLE